MKNISFFLFILIFISCKKDKIDPAIKLEKTQNKIVQLKDSVSKISIDTIKINTKNIGFYDNFEKKKKLRFDSISEIEFNKQSNSNSFFKQTNFKQDKNFFYIQTKKENHKFKVYKDYGGKESYSGFEFLGFYEKLNLFAITSASVSEDLGFSELFLIDKNTNYQYTIISFGDGAVELPIPSKNDKFLVYYYNSVYEHQNSDIGVLKINQNSKPENLLEEFASFKSDFFAIEKIVWVSDNSFYVKGYKEVYDGYNWIKNYTYYKTIF